MTSTFCFCFLEPTSDFQAPITFLQVYKIHSVGIHFLNWIKRNILVIKIVEHAESFIFLNLLQLVQLLEDRHIM